jgi:predicted O-methyltransferase YrrM
LKPEVYLEVGVQFGTSLLLAIGSNTAIGIDPNPLITDDDLSVLMGDNQRIIKATSNEAFGPTMAIEYPPIDLAFIDGLHHAEQALKDFIHIARRLAPAGVIVFDDVLPRNQGEAARRQCPGDWTGDVWRIAAKINAMPGVSSIYVNTEPTGVLVVTSVTKEAITVLSRQVPHFTRMFQEEIDVPQSILNRELAWGPLPALDHIASFVA